VNKGNKFLNIILSTLNISFLIGVISITLYHVSDSFLMATLTITLISLSGICCLVKKKLNSAKLTADELCMRLTTLDRVNTHVMIADHNFNICYINKPLMKMLTKSEDTIKESLPQFKVSTLLGQNIDIMHKNPAHQRKIVGELDKRLISNITVGELEFKLILDPIFSDGRRIGTSVEWQDCTELNKQELMLAQIKGALESCRANVMIADVNYNINYLNSTMYSMLAGIEKELQSVVPNFRVNEIMGTNIDSFHKNPKHQREILDNLTNTYETDLHFSGLILRLLVTPIFNNDKERIGTVVKWSNKTEEIKSKTKMDQINHALDVCNTMVMIANSNNEIVYMNRSLQGMFATAAQNMNQSLEDLDFNSLLSNADGIPNAIADQNKFLDGLTKGYATDAEFGGLHLSLKINPFFKEDKNTKNMARFGTVVEWHDRAEEKVIENQVTNIVNEATNGELSSRIPTDNKTGFIKMLGINLNKLMGINSDVLSDVLKSLQQLSKGDLTESIQSDYSGLFGEVVENINKTFYQLNDILGKIVTASNMVDIGVGEISLGNKDLQSRTESQASTLEETSASMEEIAASVKENSQKLQDALTMSSDASSKAQDGGKVVRDVVEAMDNIGASSKKIDDIIGVIDEIAFQTNLLALNAAVEAARAGDQGSGFAVVASEVRNLAQRSASSAREIKELIKDSANKVSEGTKLARRSGNALDDIVNVVNQVHESMEAITKSSKEQELGIQQINTAISELDKMTQQNSALVEEVTAASENMKTQTNELQKQVNNFKIKGLKLEKTSHSSAVIEHDAGSPAIEAPKPAIDSTPPVSSSSNVKVVKPNDDNSDEWETF